MSIIGTNKLNKASSRAKVQEKNDVNVNLRKYNVNKEENNQSNRWYGGERRESRGGVLARHDEGTAGYRYKSYDYLPVKYHSEISQNNRRVSRNSSYSPEYNKYRRPSQLTSSRRFSSTEDVDHSRNEYSSDNSRKHTYNPSFQNYGNCITRNPRNNYENKKYSIGHQKIYDHSDSYNKRLYHNSNIEKPKKTSFSNNFANNNRSNTMKNYSPLEDKGYSRRFENENDNFSSRHDNNVMSLKSTYRTDENIPHSGTILEGHRKQMDKYCTGNRYSESHNSDRGSQYKSSLVNKNKKVNKHTLLPQSPKHSNFRKCCNVEKESLDDHKYKFHSPQRKSINYYEGLTDEDSCYFENCRNSNNEYLKKPPLAYRNETKDYGTSPSECDNSSSLPLSNEKPTESIPLSFSSPKIDKNLLTTNIKETPKKIKNPLSEKDNIKHHSIKHRHSCHLSKHPSDHRHH